MAETRRGFGGVTDGPLRSLPPPGQVWQLIAGVDAWGPWSIVVADTGPVDAYLMGLYVDNLNAAAVLGVHVRATAGELGAPEPLASWRPGRMAAGGSVFLPSGFPIRVRAGSRVAMSAAAGTGIMLNVGIAYVLL